MCKPYEEIDRLTDTTTTSDVSGIGDETIVFAPELTGKFNVFRCAGDTYPISGEVVRWVRAVNLIMNQPFF